MVSLKLNKTEKLYLKKIQAKLNKIKRKRKPRKARKPRKSRKPLDNKVDNKVDIKRSVPSFETIETKIQQAPNFPIPQQQPFNDDKIQTMVEAEIKKATVNDEKLRKTIKDIVLSEPFVKQEQIESLIARNLLEYKKHESDDDESELLEKTLEKYKEPLEEYLDKKIQQRIKKSKLVEEMPDEPEHPKGMAPRAPAPALPPAPAPKKKPGRPRKEKI